MSDLPQEVAKVVYNLKPGEVSEAFTMINNKGKEVVAIVKLRNRIEGHKATMTEDYQRLKEIVANKRRNEKLDQWIKEKQRTTYIRVNPEWVKCDFRYPGWVK
jgi:peptidyl-prolyl cis-trans isomerase SurA